MSELNTESEAESLLMSAVMAPDSQEIDAPEGDGKAKLDPPQDLDKDEQEADGEGEEGEAKQATKAEAEEAPDEDEIEIPGEDGQEPKRLKVSELVQKAQEFDRIESQKAQIIEQVETQAVQQATQRLRQVEQAGQQMGYMIQAALQLLQEPRAPDHSLLNRNSPNYDPDAYHMARAQYDVALQQHGAAKQLGAQLLQQAQAASARATEERETVELTRLQRAWPEFGQTETVNKFVTDMGKAYGFSAEELDAVLTDHRQALVARDALAFRAMKQKSGDVKAKVEAKAPKLVRSNQEAKGSPAQNRDTKGRYASDALARLKATNSEDAATAYFTGLVKSGRI